MSNPALNIRDVFGLPLDKDAVQSFAGAGRSRCAATAERVQDDPAGWRDEAAEIGDQIDRLDGRMLRPGAILFVSFRGVKKKRAAEPLSPRNGRSPCSGPT